MYRTFTNNEIITDGRENKNLPRLPINISNDEIETKKDNFIILKLYFYSNEIRNTKDLLHTNLIFK